MFVSCVGGGLIRVSPQYCVQQVSHIVPLQYTQVPSTTSNSVPFFAMPDSSDCISEDSYAKWYNHKRRVNAPRASAAYAMIPYVPPHFRPH